MILVAPLHGQVSGRPYCSIQKLLGWNNDMLGMQCVENAVVCVVVEWQGDHHLQLV